MSAKQTMPNTLPLDNPPQYSSRPGSFHETGPQNEIDGRSKTTSHRSFGSRKNSKDTLWENEKAMPPTPPVDSETTDLWKDNVSSPTKKALWQCWKNIATIVMEKPTASVIRSVFVAVLWIILEKKKEALDDYFSC